MDMELLEQYLNEANELLEDVPSKLLQLESTPQDQVLLNDIFRAFHTVKGGASFLSLNELVDLCHRSEDIFDKLRSGEHVFTPEYMDVFSVVVDRISTMLAELGNGNYKLEPAKELISQLDALLTGGAEAPVEDDLEALFLAVQSGSYNLEAEAAKANPPVIKNPEPAVPSQDVKKTESQQVRVDTIKLDSIMNLVGELVLTRNRLKTISGHLADSSLAAGIGQLDYITSELQSSVMSTRMQPVRKVFQRFPKLVRDLSRSLSKQIRVVLNGEETELDKNLVDALADPLVHMVRNSVDHGIEMPSERVKVGKKEEGVIELHAKQIGDYIEIVVRDDGKGIDPDVMRRKGVEKGLLSQEQADLMSDDEALQIIFYPGFSTAASVTNISGRGVGMDVVKTTITSLNGSISIQSKRNEGSVFRLRIPLTLAIMDTLLVGSGEQCFALPLSMGNEIFFEDECKFNVINHCKHAQIRGQSIPVYYLDKLFPHKKVSEKAPSRRLIVLDVAEQLVALVVDCVYGQEEVVIKPMGALLKNVKGYSGATITGDGRVALIIDVAKLIR